MKSAYHCIHCDIPFSRKWNYDRHMVNRHSQSSDETPSMKVVKTPMVCDVPSSIALEYFLVADSVSTTGMETHRHILTRMAFLLVEQFPERAFDVVFRYFTLLLPVSPSYFFRMSLSPTRWKEDIPDLSRLSARVQNTFLVAVKQVVMHLLWLQRRAHIHHFKGASIATILQVYLIETSDIFDVIGGESVIVDL